MWPGGSSLDYIIKDQVIDRYVSIFNTAKEKYITDEKNKEEQRLIEERKRKQEEREREEAERRKNEQEEREKVIAAKKHEEELKKRAEEQRIKRLEDEKEETDDYSIYSDKVEYNNRALSPFIENPYFILGTACNASKEQIRDSVKKISKYEQIKKLDSYKAPYRLKHIPIERNLSMAQQAEIDVSENIKYKWFWFEKTEECLSWFGKEHRKIIEAKETIDLEYDQFLAYYFYALVEDPDLKNHIVWTKVLSYIDIIIYNRRFDVLKRKLTKEELGIYSDDDILESFINTIFVPLKTTTLDDIMQMIQLYKLMESCKSDAFTEYRQEQSSEIIKWFNDINNETLRQLEEIDVDSVRISEALKTKKMAKVYYEEIDEPLKEAELLFSSERIKLEILAEGYKDISIKFLVIMLEGDMKDQAAEYANKAYRYCDDKVKASIRSDFGFDIIDGAEKDATDQEIDIVGDWYANGEHGRKKNMYKAAQLYRRAADMGNMYSQNSYGILLLKGDGISQNISAAKLYFEKAADQGNTAAMNNLARMYVKGEGVNQDIDKAIEYWLRAGRAGDKEALELAKKALEIKQKEEQERKRLELERLRRKSEHSNYDIGFVAVSTGIKKIVEVTLNYSANVYLMTDLEYRSYIDHKGFQYYGERVTESPYRIQIPHTGHWHLIIDNGEDGMNGIESQVNLQTITN